MRCSFARIRVPVKATITRGDELTRILDRCVGLDALGNDWVPLVPVGKFHLTWRVTRQGLAADPKHMLGLRTLGLAITDQFTGGPADRYGEVDAIFQGLADAYERLYYSGLLCERRVKAQLRGGRAPHTLLPLLEKALQCFAEAEKIHPPGNDDAILRWNRCVRLLQSQPNFEVEEVVSFEAHDSPPA